MEKEINKYLEGKATESEMKILLDWLEDSNATEFKKQKNLWKENIHLKDLPTNTLSELDRFKSEIIRENFVKIKKMAFVQNAYKYAAILLVFIAVGGIFSNYFIASDSTVQYNTIFAENGQISKALLPDSTVVWLNSGTMIRYNSTFGIDNRKIELIGEAYFDVTKNAHLPMVVSCDKINIRVLGTEFTAKFYPGNNETSVVLVEGSIELLAGQVKKAFAKMSPNQLLVFNRAQNDYKISEVISGKYTSWREGTVNFYDQQLREVLPSLQRRYNQKIVLDKSLEDYHVTFSIHNEDFNEVMKLISRIAPIKITQKGEIIYMER